MDGADVEPEYVEEAEHLAAGRTPAHAVLEFCGVALFFGLTATTAKKMCDYFMSYNANSTTVCLIGVALVLGILAADFGSGIVHWGADNWGSVNLPGVGAAIIRPFRHHHVDAYAITRHDFLELNGNNFIVTLPLVWVAVSAVKSPDNALSLVSATFWLSFAVFGAFTNQIHSWAHMKNPPMLVRVLQNSGLLLSREHHHLHHVRPHDCNYCITTGWMNGPLRAIGFFEAAERAITGVTGVIPLHKQLS